MSDKPADSSIDTSATLVVFCRRPVTGNGKRRIAHELGDGPTLELARLLLATTLEDAGIWPGPVIVAPASPADARWAAGLLPAGCEVIPQPAGNLGERINAVDAAARTRGHSILVYIGSDAPVLTPEYYGRARAALAGADVVLGPAADGGVTLMGAARAWPDLKALPWSTDRLGRALERTCHDHDISVASLEPRYDVDLVTDLERLQDDLERDRRPARQALLHWIKQHAASQPDLGAPRKPRISVVVPVLGDLPALRELLVSVRRMSPAPFEVIVVDGGEDRSVASLCNRYGCIRLRTRSGRGHQLHAGAMRAGGDAIWFLHADAEPGPDALDRIREQIEAGAVGGYFRFQFNGENTWYKSLLAMLINLRCRIGIPYGDQGLFIRRANYPETAGFADVPLFEEVQFVRGARKAGRFCRIDAPLGVSARRWERDGWLRRTLQNRMLAFGYMLGVSPARLARRYDGRQDKRPAQC